MSCVLRTLFALGADRRAHALRFKRHDDKKPAELRAFLRSGNATLSETWSYIVPVQ